MAAPESSGGGGEGEGAMRRSKVNQELWYACAGPLVALPPAGSLVVYFPQGHSEQVYRRPAAAASGDSCVDQKAVAFLPLFGRGKYAPFSCCSSVSLSCPFLVASCSSADGSFHGRSVFVSGSGGSSASAFQHMVLELLVFAMQTNA
jgi:hypothetical protein